MGFIIVTGVAVARYNALRGSIVGVANVRPTYSGYVKVDKDGSSIYYAYYEAQNKSDEAAETPIVLWLQGGPGCASTFGGFYELGPWSVTPDLGVVQNPGSWNRLFGLLLMDQPVGTGYSLAASPTSSTPRDEVGVATHLYAGLQGFFEDHHWLATRPVFIAGESYAGKYVPSIAHYILQAQEDAASVSSSSFLSSSSSSSPSPSSSPGGPAAPLPLQFRRALPPHMSPPLFKLAGVAVGNGLTDPRAQTQTLAAAAYYAGLLPPALRDEVAGRAAAVVALIDEGSWVAAHTAREQLRSFITNVTGLGTMFDTRRTAEYDPTKAVDRFLNLSEIKEAMRANPEVSYESCSAAVREAMAGDVMRSVKQLLPDVLRRIPVMLYQGQYDILDGVASVSSWLPSLDYDDRAAFSAERGQLWYLEGGGGAGRRGGGAGLDGRSDGGGSPAGHVAGWWRSAGRLTQVVVYRAGHMVPHDQPLAAQQMIEHWVASVLGSWHGKQPPPPASAKGAGHTADADSQTGFGAGTGAGVGTHTGAEGADPRVSSARR